MVLGSPGGSRIITIVLETILNVIDYGMSPQEAVDAPGLHHQWLPDTIFAERFALSPDTKAALEAMGRRAGTSGTGATSASSSGASTTGSSSGASTTGSSSGASTTGSSGGTSTTGSSGGAATTGSSSGGAGSASSSGGTKAGGSSGSGAGGIADSGANIDGNSGTGGGQDAGTVLGSSGDGGVPLDSTLLGDCTGTSPITCTIPAPNGNYDVTVSLGSATAAATTRVQAELLRIELQPTATTAGMFFSYTFTVNVRTEKHNTYSAPGNILNLLFDGTAPAASRSRGRSLAELHHGLRRRRLHRLRLGSKRVGCDHTCNATD